MARNPFEQLQMDRHFKEVERYRKTGQTLYSLLIAGMPEDERPKLWALERLHREIVLDANILDALDKGDGA